MPAPGALILLAAVSASGCLASPAHPDGFALGRAPLAPPYAVVLISCSGLLAFIFLLLTCLCCKRGDVGFKEFENPEGEDCSGEYTPPAEETSSSQSLPDVYILPLAEVSLPMPAPQPSHSDMTTPLFLSRQHLSYLQEIGSGWFGKVILGEIFSDYTPAQVVVKELRASAGPLEQRKFISEAQPYRSLQHPNVLQCLGVCVETLPFLLIMEFCQLVRVCGGRTGWRLDGLRGCQQTETPFSPEGAFPCGGAAEEEGVPRPRAPPEPPDPGAPRPPPDPGPHPLPGTREKPTFVVQVSTEQLLMSLREDVTRNLLGEKGANPRETGPRKVGRGPGNREKVQGPSRDPTVLGSGKKAPSPNEEPSLPMNGVTVQNGGQRAPDIIEEKVAENGAPGTPEREEKVPEKVLENGEVTPPRREEKVLENGELRSPEREEKVLVNGGLTASKIEKKVSEDGGLRPPRNTERLPETGPRRAPGPWEKAPESGVPAPETLLERAPEPGAVALSRNGGETVPGPTGPAPKSGVLEPGTERRAPETGGAPRAPGVGRPDLGSGGRAPVGTGMAPGGGLGSGVDAKAGWADNTRPQPPPPPPPPPEAQPRRPEPAPQRARPEVASEGEPGAPDSRAGGDTAPSTDGDPPQPERKGPEMPRLFLDLGPPQGNSEQIKAKLSRLSLALPPLTLTPFPGPGPRRPPWEGADAGAAGGEAGGAGAPGPAEEDGEDEDEDEEEDEEASASGAAAGPQTPGGRGSFEWAEDFPLLPPPGPPLCFSRFSVSPALETPGPPARAPDARPAESSLRALCCLLLPLRRIPPDAQLARGWRAQVFPEHSTEKVEDRGRVPEKSPAAARFADGQLEAQEGGRAAQRPGCGFALWLPAPPAGGSTESG
eukprot:XP_022260763.1 serine/threonine-protein kinase LMTK3 [Canis lupus familiaris]